MCDPITASLAIGALTTAGGTYLQSKAADDAQDKINSLRYAADQTNNQLIADTQALQQDAAMAFGGDRFETDTDAQTQALASKFADNLSTGFSGLDFAGTPEIVRQSDAKQQAKSQEFSKNFADALAQLRGFDQNLFNQNLNIGRTGEATQLNSGFIQGNANALNSDLQMVDPSSPFGDALVVLGGQALASGATAGIGPAKKPPIPAKKPPIKERFK